MIHYIDILDIVGYFNTKEISINKLIEIKNIIEKNITSVEVDISDESIYRFIKHFNKCEYKKDIIYINLNGQELNKLYKLKSKYMEKEIKNLIPTY